MEQWTATVNETIYLVLFSSYTLNFILFFKYRKMKAAVYREHNKDPRKVVKIEDIEIPKIKCNQVLIKVEAVSFCVTL